MAQRRQFSGAFKAEAAGTAKRLPLFCCILGVLAIPADAQNGDFRLRASSPCADMGRYAGDGKP